MDLIKKIKNKKEFSGIPDKMILKILEELKLDNFNNLNKKDEKIIIKQVRNELRKFVGRFKVSSKTENLIKQNKISEILNLHYSTKERIEFYPKFKLLLKKINPNSILDLGCGLNPLVIANSNVKYYASDIDENNLKLINLFFKKNKFPGKTFIADIRTERNFPKSDLCLILKVFDIVKMPHHEIESLLTSIKTKLFIISFPTVTLSGKPMQKSKRFWFEKILNKINYSFKLVKSNNEIFYIIKPREFPKII